MYTNLTIICVAFLVIQDHNDDWMSPTYFKIDQKLTWNNIWKRAKKNFKWLYISQGGAVARLAERSTTGAGPWVRFPVRPLDLAETEFRQSDLGLDDAEFSESLGSNQLPASPRPPGC